MGAACRYILLIFSVWVWSVSSRPSTGQTLKENWYSPRQADTTECGFVNDEPVACCNSSDYGMCIAYLNPNVNDGKCSPVPSILSIPMAPRTKTTKTKSPIEVFRKSKQKQNKNKVNGTRNKRQHENKMGKASKQKVKTKLKIMKILKKIPKICPGPCVCDFKFMVKIKKLKTKHRVAVRKLYRIQAWWKLLKFGKQYKAKGDATIVPKKEPTFSIPFGFLSSATNGATTCGCSSLSSHPNNNNITSIYNQLKNCTRTATWACSTKNITLTKDMDKNNCTDCSSSVCVQSDTNCAANKSYRTSCKPRWQNFTLTQEMVTHIEDVCLPQLNAWIKRYRSCASCKTYADCVYSCQSDTNLYNCQSRSCDIDTLCGVNNNCIFETCLKNGINGGLDNSGCMCDCYKSLEEVDVSKGAQFPISLTTVGGKTLTNVDGMNCYELAAFERLVYTRRNRCLDPGGITEDNNDGLGVDLQDYTGGPFPLVPGLKTSAPSVKDRLSGNFVDCRFQGRQAFEWIYKCSIPCCTSTSSSTIPSATSFSTSTSTSSTATTTVTLSTTTATSTSTTTSKTNTASTASTTKTSTKSSTSTTTATISTTTSTKTLTTTPTTTTTTTSTATISTTTSITTSTTTSTTTPTTTTTTTTTTSTTTPTTTTTTTTSTTTTTMTTT